MEHVAVVIVSSAIALAAPASVLARTRIRIAHVVDQCRRAQRSPLRQRRRALQRYRTLVTRLRRA